MTFKKAIKIGMLGLLLFLIIPGIKSMAQTTNKALLIYDSKNVYGETFNALNDVNRIVTESNEKVDIINLQEVNQKVLGSLNEYSNIVFLNCNTENLDKNFIEGINKEKDRLIYISNIENTGLEYKNKIGLINNENEYFTFRNEILNDLNNKEIQQNRYLMINNVDPFMDLNILVSKIKYLNEQGIPFILNTIPVFENPTFKAMQNFTEALRYAQASGGYVVLSCPYLNQGTVTSQEIFTAMEEGYKNYINYLVYPIGFSMPNYLLYRNDFKEDLEKSNTMFVENTSVDLSFINNYSNSTFKNLIQEVPYNQINQINSMKGNIAITLNNDETLDEFKTNVQNLVNEGISFSSARSLNSEVEINGNKIECTTNGVYLNGKYVQQTSYISNTELFKTTSKQEPEKDGKNIDISKVSGMLAIFAIVVCLIFVLLTLLSKRIDRKKYFR